MHTISNWARQHAIAARLLLCILHTCLVVSAMLLCRLLAARHITISFKSALFVSVIGFGMVLTAGYFKKTINKRISIFRLQKFRFLLTGICCIVLITGFYSGGSFLKYHTYSSLNGAFAEKKAKTVRPAYEGYNDKKLFYEDLKIYYKSLSKKELRKELRHELKSLAKSPGSGENTVAIIGIILGMLFLLMAVALVACNISCAGADALGAIVGIVGAVGVIWLTVYLIKRTLRKQKK